MMSKPKNHIFSIHAVKTHVHRYDVLRKLPRTDNAEFERTAPREIADPIK